MNQEPKFKHIKPGDKVFVVKQRTSNDIRIRATISADYFVVVRVGKKFGYVQHGYTEKPFNLSDGKSHHIDCNSRANGYGFGVYSSKEEYEEIVSNAKAYDDLKKRLLDRGYYLITLSPAKVKAIHAILDQKETP